MLARVAMPDSTISRLLLAVGDGALNDGQQGGPWEEVSLDGRQRWLLAEHNYQVPNLN